MATKKSMSRKLAGVLLLALFAAGLALAGPAQAQRRGGFFEQLFGPLSRPYDDERPVDYSRAPPPHKSETTPTTNVVVMGDSMADWLAYGLEDAFVDSPEIGIMRKHRAYSGLLRYEARNDAPDWPRVARETLAQERADFVVFMLGLSDRQTIREAVPAKPAPGQKQAKGQPDKNQKDKNQQQDAQQDQNSPDESDQPSIIAPEPSRGPPGVNEFRSDRWAELYGKKIDDMIAALKSKGVPVFWVGLPSIRGPRSTSDAQYLNELFRARAERAGITYVDVWDGFVDEGGKFTTQGPDLEGQIRRLRAGDGVYFTKFGARKLAHYVERELRRLMGNRGAMPVALPTDGPLGPLSPDMRPGAVARPLAGPVLPLAAAPPASEDLLGGGALRPANIDPIATRVLLKGEPVAAAPGRADDFAWPRGQAAATATEPDPAAASASAYITPPAAAPAKPDPKDAKNRAKTAQQGQTATKPQAAQPNAANAKPQIPPARPTPRPFARSVDPFGWLR
jgi:hypothetical protein